MKVIDLTYRGNMKKSKVEGKGTMFPFSKKLMDTIKISPTGNYRLIKHTQFSGKLYGLKVTIFFPHVVLFDMYYFTHQNHSYLRTPTLPHCNSINLVNLQ